MRFNYKVLKIKALCNLYSALLFLSNPMKNPALPAFIFLIIAFGTGACSHKTDITQLNRYRKHIDLTNQQLEMVNFSLLSEIQQIQMEFPDANHLAMQAVRLDNQVYQLLDSLATFGISTATGGCDAPAMYDYYLHKLQTIPFRNCQPLRFTHSPELFNEDLPNHQLCRHIYLSVLQNDILQKEHATLQTILDSLHTLQFRRYYWSVSYISFSPPQRVQNTTMLQAQRKNMQFPVKHNVSIDSVVAQEAYHCRIDSGQNNALPSVIFSTAAQKNHSTLLGTLLFEDALGHTTKQTFSAKIEHK